jgi:hypothetical protein
MYDGVAAVFRLLTFSQGSATLAAMFKFTIRELALVTIIVALGVAWCLESRALRQRAAKAEEGKALAEQDVVDLRRTFEQERKDIEVAWRDQLERAIEAQASSMSEVERLQRKGFLPYPASPRRKPGE